MRFHGDGNVARVLHIDLTRPNHSWEGKDSNESFVFLNEAEGKFRESKKCISMEREDHTFSSWRHDIGQLSRKRKGRGEREKKGCYIFTWRERGGMGGRWKVVSPLVSNLRNSCQRVWKIEHEKQYRFEEERSWLAADGEESRGEERGGNLLLRCSKQWMVRILGREIFIVSHPWDVCEKIL